MNFTFASQASFSAFASMLIFVGGCASGNPRTYPVEGKVTFPDGTPLPGGLVELEALDPKAKKLNARGKIGQDGSFRLTTFTDGDGAIEGQHRVIVHPPTLDLTKFKHDEAPPPRPILHPRFHTYEKSKLTVLVEPKANTISLKVERP